MTISKCIALLEMQPKPIFNHFHTFIIKSFCKIQDVSMYYNRSKRTVFILRFVLNNNKNHLKSDYHVHKGGWAINKYHTSYTAHLDEFRKWR